MSKIRILEDVIYVLNNIDPEDRSEEVGDTLDAAIDDLNNLLSFLKSADLK